MNPFAVPPSRKPSTAPLVERVRVEVDAWRAAGYPSASETSRALLRHWFGGEHELAPGRTFRYYFAQQEAVETVVYLYEVLGLRATHQLVERFAQAPVAAAPSTIPRYVVKMATGAGKTKVMSLLAAWSYFHATREVDSPLATNFLVIAPNLIVYERLLEDFEHGRIFRDDPVIPEGWGSDFDLQVCTREDPLPISAAGALVVTNIQALYERQRQRMDPLAGVLGPEPPRRLFAQKPLFERLLSRGRFMVVNDEAHHLHDEIRSDSGEPLVAIQTIQRLHSRLSDGIRVQLDLSATPRNQQGQTFPETVVDYPLAQAIEDGIVKRPIIGELSGDVEAVSDDASVRYRQRLSAGVSKWRESWELWERTGRKPLLFVMAESTNAADQIATYLDSLSDLSGRVLTIHVNMTGPNRGEIRSSELEAARQAAREIDSPDSPYRAIVSVLMLREGWDVNNVTVIVPLRAFTAKARILPEQTLGRGLRRMTRPGSGVDESLVVIDHVAFRSLWDDALSAEGLDVERRDVEEVQPTATLVTVDPSRVAYDIAIPQLSRVLTRSAEGLARLTLDDLPFRHLELPNSSGETIQYTGRDLVTGEVVEKREYPVLHADDPVAVLAWFVNEIQRETRLTGQFAVLAPLVKGYVERRAFDQDVTFDDPRVLRALAQPVVQEMILRSFRDAVDNVTLDHRVPVRDQGDLHLSDTKPFLWSGRVMEASKSVFNVQPCDNELEVRFAAFLERCPDVVSFAKLTPEARFSLEYKSSAQRLAYYYPDFVAVASSGRRYVIETKGLVDSDVPLKDQRAGRWAVDASLASNVKWKYFRVDQSLFDAYEGRLPSLRELESLVQHGKRDRLLAALRTDEDRAEDTASRIERLKDRMSRAKFGEGDVERLRDVNGG